MEHVPENMKMHTPTAIKAAIGLRVVGKEAI